MQNVELGRGEEGGGGEVSVDDGSRLEEACGGVGSGFDGAAAAPATGEVLSIVILLQEEAAALKIGTPKSVDGRGATDCKDDKLVGITAVKKGITRSDSYHDECRVCQQQSDEPLIQLGCRCRGELAKAHHSCIEIWFRSRGSNKCEICQQVATNVPSPESQPSTNYWIWRVGPPFGSSVMRHARRETGCFSPMWVAFGLLMAGLVLDVLISFSFGISALPVNLIIGVLIVLGLGTALRLALECRHRWNMQRIAQRAAEAAPNPSYRPDV